MHHTDRVMWQPAFQQACLCMSTQEHRLPLCAAMSGTHSKACTQELGLPERPDMPLFGFIGRLDYQKGVDLIRDNFHWLMDEGAQLVLLGSGRQDLESSLKCALLLLRAFLSAALLP